MINQLKTRNFYFMLAGDFAIFVISLIFSHWIRFGFGIPAREWTKIGSLIPWVVAVKFAAFLSMDVYRGMWRYTSLPDAIRLAKASALATIALMSGLTLFFRFEGYSRSVFLADGIFTLCFCGAFRLGVRLFYTRSEPLGNFFKFWQENEKKALPRLLIVGAGNAAATIIREIKNRQRPSYELVGCVDDDLRKHRRTLHDTRVHGPITRLPHIAQRLRAEEILIAMPSVNGARMREIVAICKTTGLPFKTLPSLSSIVNGQVRISDVREVKYEDLLGRPAVQLDKSGIGQMLSGKTVAVTGAGGSIGSELCRQIVAFQPAAILLIDACEFNLYEIEKELRSVFRFPSLYPAMGRVQDGAFMRHVFGRYQPQIIFHAAACKHVPMVEWNPREGMLCNVFGSQTAMDAAEEHGAELFVLISSDKAVRPTNIMGASKRLAEILVQARPAGATRFLAVRFGNVLGSSGSVIPLFREQIAAGGPVTVTHPDMTRYFMMIPEACQLILQAGVQGKGGEIFLLEMGTPVKIADMARDMIRLAGKTPEQDIEIVFTGLRPGEKLFEELIAPGEDVAPTLNEKIMILGHNGGKKTLADGNLRAQIEQLAQACDTFDPARIKTAIKAIVPEYNPAQNPVA